MLSKCATSVYISSQTDPNYHLSKADPIFLLLPNGASIADRQFYPVLKLELITNYFNIVEDSSKAKYILLFQTDEKTSQINSTISIPSTSITSGYVGNNYYSATTTTTQSVPYNYNYTVKKIYLTLYAMSDIKNKKYFSLWEGYVGAGAKDYASYSRAVIKKLLDYYGTNYKAHTRIDRNYGK